MTRTIYLFTLAALCLASLMAHTAFAGEKEKRKRHLAPSMEGLKFRDAATHSQLSMALKTSQQTNSLETGKLKVTTLEKDPSKTSVSNDFIENSDILCLNGSATFIPKRAVLNLPDRFSERFKLKKDSKVLTFPDFYLKNRSWIMTYEVTIEQAFGKEPFDEKKLEWLQRCGRVVVATFKKGPITVLPYVEETEEETSEKDPKS